jgi:hypothetical protein
MLVWWLRRVFVMSKTVATVVVGDNAKQEDQ